MKVEMNGKLGGMEGQDERKVDINERQRGMEG